MFWEARATSAAFAGGQELQPWDWKSSIMVTGSRASGPAAEDGGGREGVRSAVSFWEW